MAPLALSPIFAAPAEMSRVSTDCQAVLEAGVGWRPTQAAGTVDCSGTPKVCSTLSAPYVGPMTGIDSGITVAAAAVFGIGYGYGQTYLWVSDLH